MLLLKSIEGHGHEQLRVDVVDNQSLQKRQTLQPPGEALLAMAGNHSSAGYSVAIRVAKKRGAHVTSKQRLRSLDCGRRPLWSP
jgi:hypothetical protein